MGLDVKTKTKESSGEKSVRLKEGDQDASSYVDSPRRGRSGLLRGQVELLPSKLRYRHSEPSLRQIRRNDNKHRDGCGCSYLEGPESFGNFVHEWEPGDNRTKAGEPRVSLLEERPAGACVF